jgi:hypothetical protein
VNHYAQPPETLIMPTFKEGTEAWRVDINHPVFHKAAEEASEHDLFVLFLCVQSLAQRISRAHDLGTSTFSYAKKANGQPGTTFPHFCILDRHHSPTPALLPGLLHKAM